ncbi:MAG: hypothetical protein IJ583_15830 [Firmicutes bacterium]|nr:hypothetical protein [Bacillota bacterium]
MKSIEAWLKIIKGCERKKVELLTYPEIGEFQKWFSVTSSGKTNELIIEQCSNKSPVLKMSRPVKISIKQFDYIYPYYFKKEGITNKNAAVYRKIIFALISYFCFNKVDQTLLMSEKENDRINKENSRNTRGAQNGRGNYQGGRMPIRYR